MKNHPGTHVHVSNQVPHCHTADRKANVSWSAPPTADSPKDTPITTNSQPSELSLRREATIAPTVEKATAPSPSCALNHASRAVAGGTCPRMSSSATKTIAPAML